MTPRQLRPLLNASERTIARERIADTLVANFVHLSEEDRKECIATWAMISSGEDVTEDAIAEAAGIKLIKTDIADFVKNALPRSAAVKPVARQRRKR